MTKPMKNGAATLKILRIVLSTLNLSIKTTERRIQDKITTTNNTLSIFLLKTITLFKFSTSNSFFFLTLITTFIVSKIRAKKKSKETSFYITHESLVIVITKVSIGTPLLIYAPCMIFENEKPRLKRNDKAFTFPESKLQIILEYPRENK